MQMAVDAFAWISVLVATFVFTVVEHLATFHNVKRGHHRERLLEECYAKHQWAYFSFYLVTLVSINFDVKSTLAKLLLLSGLIALFFWSMGLVIMRLTDTAIEQHHCPGTTCTLSLSPDLLKWNRRMAEVMAAVSLGMILALSYLRPGAI